MRSVEFDSFYFSLPERIQEKINYALNIIAEIRVVNKKIVKKLAGTDFYELRVSFANEYRIIIFTIDNDNFIEAQRILLLNGFVKKSTKDYKRELNKAIRILNNLNDETEY